MLLSQIASSLTLVAGAIALNAAMKYDLAEEEALVESEERPADGSLVHQTLAVTGILTATAAVTLLLQTGLVLASKCCVYIYEPSLSTLVYLKLTVRRLDTMHIGCTYVILQILQDFLASSVLLLAATGSTTVEGLVAYHWANMDQDSADDDNLFKVVAGSTVSYFSYQKKIHFPFTDIFPSRFLAAGFWLSVRTSVVCTVFRDFLQLPLVTKITITQNYQKYCSRVVVFLYTFAQCIVFTSVVFSCI